mgnify:CR=1 FL=1
MEEKTVELFDYFSVIWKRKRLIIVMLLVSIAVGVGVAVKNLRKAKTPAILYSVDAIIKIGQMVKMTLNDAYLTPMDEPVDLVETIPLTYAEKVREVPGCHLEVIQIGKLPLIKLCMTGPDEKVKGLLEEIVDMINNEHRERAKKSALAYKEFIKKLETDARIIQGNISLIEASIIKMKEKEKATMLQMDSDADEAASTEYVENMTNLSVIWNMLYLKTIDKEIDLSKSRQDLRNIQWQLLVHRTTIESLKKYNTRMVGEISMKSVVKNSKESSTNIIIVAVVAGLIMSLFIVFFWEYIEESKARRKGK